MDWDIESENLRLENMLTVYEEHIKIIEKENDNLKEQVIFLKKQLEYKTFGHPKQEIENEQD